MRHGASRTLHCFVLPLVLALSIFVPSLARAHDPYETTTQVLVGRDQVKLRTVMARATAIELLGVEHVSNPGQSWSNKLFLNELYEVSSEGKLLALQESKAAEGTEGEAKDDFVFDLVYSATNSAKFSIRARYLEKLDQGYTGVVQVLEADSMTLLDIKVLHASDPMLEFAQPQAATHPQTKISKTPQPFLLFFKVGVEHVVVGYDHVLFLLGVLLACFGIRQVLAVLTTFTLAHSVTLSLAIFDVLPLASEIVEPVIALSIAVAAFWGRSLEKRNLLLPITFAFGLIHGLGFAAGLQALADSEHVRILSLIGFNLGVEVGQVGAALLLLPLLEWCRSYHHGTVALTWTSRAVGAAGAAIFIWRVAGAG